MIYLLNMIVALFVWLGLFRLDLFSALMSRPFGEVLATLTMFDYLLLLVTFVVVTAAMQILDRYTGAKKQQSKG